VRDAVRIVRARWGLIAVPLAVVMLRGGRAVAAPRGLGIEAHRGGAGLMTESTLEAFTNALGIGVSTLELDVRLTEEGRPVVIHDRRIGAATCSDTGAAVAGDPEFPYVGDLVGRLSVAQLATLDCGRRQLPGFPTQQVVRGARIPSLEEVLSLVACDRASGVRLAIEPKYAAARRDETTTRARLAGTVLRAVRSAGLVDRVTIDGFDWRLLMRVRRLEPAVRVVATASPHSLERGRPGASPWLGGLDIDDFGGDLVRAAAAIGVHGIAPLHGRAGLTFTTRGMVRRAHRAGLTVVPWNADEPAVIGRLIDAGVDGVTTNYPDRVRAVAAGRGLALPAPVAGGGC